MSEKQQTLPTVKRANHSNRGRALEDALERTHHFYAVKKLACMRKQPNEWTFASRAKADLFARHGLHRNFATTGDGRTIVRQKSDVDFIGCASGKYVAFDCKSTKEKSFSFTGMQRHQLENLLATERAGGIAGLMIEFSSVGRVFFAAASFIESRYMEMLFKGGRKSISFADLETNAIEIPVRNNLVDWLEKLVK